MKRLYATTVLLFLGIARTLSAQVTLQPQYSEGTTSQVVLTTVVKQELLMAGVPTELESSTRTVTRVSTGKRLADGTLKVTEKISELKAELTLPLVGKVSFDSATPDKRAPSPGVEPLFDVYRATLKNTIVKVLDGDNRVREVQVDDEVLKELNPLLRRPFDPQALKQQALHQLSQFPDRAVNVGDIWKRTAEFPLDGTAKLETKRSYRYAGPVDRRGKMLDRVVGTTQSVVLKQVEGSAFQYSNCDLKVVTSQSELLFDRGTGTTVSNIDKLRIKGTMSVTVMGREIPGQLDLTTHTIRLTRPLVEQTESRVWKSKDGRFKLEAIMVGIKGGIVQLKKQPDGDVISVRIDQLSDADQRRLKSLGQ